MQPDAIRAQADTLREWAAMWERDLSEGSTEIAFQMRRAARLIDGAPVDKPDDALPPTVVEHARAG